MKRLLPFVCFLVCVAVPALAQEREAPNVTGIAVQGVSVNLDYYRGDKNVLVVFYRTHS